MTPEAKVMNARMKLRKDVPYIGDVLLYLQPSFDDRVGTMGVDMDGKLTVSPTWTETLTPEQVIAVVIHEVLHILLLHTFRDPPDVMAVKHGKAQMTPEIKFKHEMFNVACDLKINFMFHEMGKFNDLPESDCKPTQQGTWTFTVGNKRKTLRDIQAKSVERIYKEIIDAFEDEDQMPGCQGRAGDGTEGGNTPERFDSHDGWAHMDPNADSKGTTQRASDWMVRAAGVLNSHKSKGNLPGSLLRELELLLTPIIPWQGKLQRFVQPIVATETSYRRPRRSGWALGLILPGRSGEGVHIIAHVDTSGSMQKKELEQITAELYGILDAYPHVRITLLHSDDCDPEVIELRETDREDILGIVKLEGGGGTSHRQVAQWVLDNNDEMTQALICFTDGYSDIQHCFDKLVGVVFRMLIITSEDQIEKLADYCEDSAYLPVA